MVIYKRALAIYAEALWLRLILYNKKIFFVIQNEPEDEQG